MATKNTRNALADPRGEMRATPRKNALMGYLADALTAVSDYTQRPDERAGFGDQYSNPPLAYGANMLGLPAIANTAQRLSYGEPLTTGVGMATQMRPDTVGAAMAVAPVVAKWPKQALGAAGMLAGGAGDLNSASHAVTVGAWKNVFHGTRGSFDPKNFDVGMAGSATGHESAEAPVMWTTARPEVANIFTSRVANDAYPISSYGPAGQGVKSIRTSDTIDGANIMPMQVKINNPKVIGGSDAEKLIFGNAKDDWRDTGSDFVKFVQSAKDAGHDGIIIKANPMGPLEFRAEQYLPFDPASQTRSIFDKNSTKQIKSSTQQASKFDSQVKQEIAPDYYSMAIDHERNYGSSPVTDAILSGESIDSIRRIAAKYGAPSWLKM